MKETNCRKALAYLIVHAMLITVAMQAEAQVRSEENRSTMSTSTEKADRQVSSADADSRQRRRFWLYANLSIVFDSNIDHDETNVQSFGLVPTLGFHFQNSSEKPAFEFDYETALHRYTNTSRWDRMSHKARASYERRLTSFLTSETTGEMSIKGSSEDRELNDQYVLRQELQMRPSRTRRLKLFGAYRLKRYADDQGRNAINPYIGAGFEQRFAGRRSFEVSYRYDKNRSRSPRNRYIRRTFGGEFKTPFLRSDGALSVEVKYRQQLYARTVEIEDDNGDDHDVTRRDRRWIVGASWQRPVDERFEISFRYNFEMRRSNDLEKNFNSHGAGVALSYRWWR